MQEVTDVTKASQFALVLVGVKTRSFQSLQVYSLRESFKSHVFKRCMQSHVEICTIKYVNLLSLSLQ